MIIADDISSYNPMLSFMHRRPPGLGATVRRAGGTVRHLWARQGPQQLSNLLLSQRALWGRTMKHMIGRGSVTACLAVFAVGLLASGCDWAQLGFASSHTGYNQFDTTITPTNVSTLVAHFSATDGTTGKVTPQAVVNGVLYVSNASGLEAYSASGTTGCSGSPSTCAPLRSYATGALGGNLGVLNSNIAVVNGVVYASTSGGLEAFDAAGQSNCSGTPIVCQPLWTSAGTFGSPTVSNGTVFMTTTTGVEAFDANGNTDCSGNPKVCSPVWTTSIGDTGTAVAVSGGIAYAVYFSQVNGSGAIALDASGTRNCGGTPKVCNPLWYYKTAYNPSTWNGGDLGYPIILGSTLYVGTGGLVFPAQVQGNLEAFDANGVTNCSGAPNLDCSPVWSSPNGTTGWSPRIAGAGTVFQPPPVPDAQFAAFAANGSNSTSPWFSSIDATPVAVGGSTLYASNGTNVYAFDAGGSAGCSGSPKICSPLWSAPGTDAIIANGTLYVGATDPSGNGEVVGYGLP